MEYKYPSLKKIKTDFINGNFIKNIELNNKHPQDVHIGLTIEDMLTRFIIENNTASCFYDEIDYQYSIYQSIIQNYENIYKTLNTIENGERFEVQIYDEKKHYGITQNTEGFLNKVETNTITTILEKREKSPYGMQIITIFPNISIKYATVLDDDLTENLKNCEGYLKSNSLTRLYYEIAIMKERPCTIMNIRQKQKWESDNISFEIWNNNHTMKYQALITYYKVWWKEVRRVKKDGELKWKSRKLYHYQIIDLMLEHQKFINFVQNATQRLDKIKKEVSLDRQHYIQNKNKMLIK